MAKCDCIDCFGIAPFGPEVTVEDWMSLMD